MTGKTHLSVGMASGLMLLAPSNPTSIILTMLTAGAGALVSDLDADHSKAESMLKSKQGWVSIGAIMVLSSIMGSKSSMLGMIIGGIMFLALCLYGSTTPHRTFMHSIECCILLTIAVMLLTANTLATVAFAIGMLSHILIDLPNRKKVMVSVLLRKEICFHKCSSNGVTSWVLNILGSVVIGLYLMTLVI